MISAILFDFGGTLDANGLHWLDHFYKIYSTTPLSKTPKNKLKEAFYWADNLAYQDPAMRTSCFRPMVERHVHWQFQKLAVSDPTLERSVADKFIQDSERILRLNCKILADLKKQGCRLGIISNNYGNLPTLCKEFGLDGLLDVALDSALIGLAKPDPKIFELALQKLKLPASEVAFVGDSFLRDIVPAKSLGMTTYWLVGTATPRCPDPRKVNAQLKSLEDLLPLLSKQAVPS